MKDIRKYFFVGARFFVLEKMLEMELDITAIVTVKDSPADKILSAKNIEHLTITSKKQLLELIENTAFDVLVSNGCPYILPISKLRKSNEVYVNIHPSLLPDLRGFHPVNGAILFDRPQGATCHLMDDGIDTGGIIAQCKVTDKPTMPLDLLYQLSFLAEAKAFMKAHELDFIPEKEKRSLEGTIYYSRKEEDQTITIEDDMDSIFTKVKAFQVAGQYAHFLHHDVIYYVLDIMRIETAMFADDNYRNNEIIHIYQNNVLTKDNDSYILWRLSSDEGLVKGEALL